MTNEETKVFSTEGNEDEIKQTVVTETPVKEVKKKKGNKGTIAAAALGGAFVGAAGVVGAATAAAGNLEDIPEIDSEDYVNDADFDGEQHEIDYTAHDGADPVVTDEIGDEAIAGLDEEPADENPMGDVEVLAVADYDGDGNEDAIQVTDGENVYTAMDFNADGNADYVEVMGEDGHYAMADIDGDGNPDVLLSDDNNDGMIGENEVYVSDEYAQNLEDSGEYATGQYDVAYEDDQFDANDAADMDGGYDYADDEGFDDMDMDPSDIDDAADDVYDI